MAIEVRVPEVGESIREVQIGRWLIPEGGAVGKDVAVAEIESDKATVEVIAPEAGALVKYLKQVGETAQVGEAIALIEPGAIGTAPAPTPAPKKKTAPVPPPASPTPPAPVAEEKPVAPAVEVDVASPPPEPQPVGKAGQRVMPAARRILAEYGVNPAEVTATGPGGRIVKEDAQRAVEGRTPVAREPEPAARPAAPAPASAAHVSGGEGREEETVPMTPMRRRIAERLVQAQQTAALLTTFNEVDMGEVMALREQYKQAFQEQHGVKLGFMSFFVKACVSALKTVPTVNAQVRGNDIVYFKYCDIGIAVGGGKGLVVPILRSAERMSFAQIEQAVADFGARAKDSKIALEEMQGGTFTISNGGIYGSMLSTPIVNPPQSGILGMHAIQDRPVARAGQVVIRPMMYLALTYDHRLVNGREAVTFLKHIKDSLEAPARLMLDL